jgi:hypothetical protein
MILDLIVWLIVGAIAGWLAGLLVKGYGFWDWRQHCRGHRGRAHCRLAVAAGRSSHRGRFDRGDH